MEKSESINELAAALVKFNQELPKIDLNSTVKVQTKTGGSYSFNYADLPHIKSICNPVLVKHGLAVSQLIENGGHLTTMLVHTSGQYIMSTMSIGDVSNKNMQEYGSQITYCRRYSYCSILGIVAEDDDDANSSEGNSFTKTEAPKTTPQTDNGLPWLNEGTAEYQKVLDGLQKGYKISDVKTKYRLSKATEQKLTDYQNEVNPK